MFLFFTAELCKDNEELTAAMTLVKAAETEVILLFYFFLKLICFNC